MKRYPLAVFVIIASLILADTLPVMAGAKMSANGSSADPAAAEESIIGEEPEEEPGIEEEPEVSDPSEIEEEPVLEEEPALEESSEGGTVVVSETVVVIEEKEDDDEEILEDPEKDYPDDDDDDDEDEKDAQREKRKGPPQFTQPHPLPELTGDWRDDFIEIARSQIGYREAEDGSSYFGNRFGLTYGAWCTCFVSWCAVSAGIPQKIIPHYMTSRKYIDFYAKRNRFYYVRGGAGSDDAQIMRDLDHSGIKTIKPSSIKPGDILLFDTDRNPDDGPDHIAIFTGPECEGDLIYNLSGNSNNSVNVTVKNISTLFGVCRPAYDKEDLAPSPVSIKSVRNTSKGIKIKWEASDDASGYEVYAKRCGDDQDDGYVQQTGENEVYTGRSWVFENVENGEKLKFYVKAYSIAGDNDNGDRVYSERSPKRSYVYLKRTKIRNIIKNEDAITVEWKKNDAADGYQIQIATDEDFENCKSVTVTPEQATTKTISGLKEDETYYVRICPFVTRKSKNYQGAWRKYGEAISFD